MSKPNTANLTEENFTFPTSNTVKGALRVAVKIGRKAYDFYGIRHVEKTANGVWLYLAGGQGDYSRIEVILIPQGEILEAVSCDLNLSYTSREAISKTSQAMFPLGLRNPEAMKHIFPIGKE